MAETRTGALPESRAMAAGRRLRDLRERLGLTLRSVEEASGRLAIAFSNLEFAIPPSRLSDIETKGVLPSLYRLQALAMIYRVGWEEILSWYGIDVTAGVPKSEGKHPPKTHLIQTKPLNQELHLPLRFDPSL